ncbi:MAG TPA: HlyD family efflux transporter periplasmic adaptor subunit [Pseudoxanthomonas sp.]|nr:HlyD family efflux transporter periplasmic adaptor subunit [Pseudoxanthomonas sp.]
MTESLFRHEVLDAKRGSWLGGISLAQPLRLWVLAAFAVAAAGSIVAFLVFGEYTRRSRVSGQLVPDLGLSTVVAPTAGVVARLFPEEGDTVGAGDSLTLINVPRATASGGDALALLREGMNTRRESMNTLGQSQAAQIDAQMAGHRRQLAAARRELAQIEDEIATRREQVRIGRENIERYREVVEEKYVSQLQLDQQQQSTLELVNAQQSLERQATAIRRSIAQLEQTLQELPAQKQALLAASSRDLAMLDQERVQQEANGELLLKSPVPGLVASRMIEAGQAVQAGQPLMALLPEGSELQAQLLVPSRAVGFIEPGDRVLLRYQAFPYQKFGHHAGRVVRVSRSAIVPADGQAQEPYYRVLVELDRQTVTAYGKSEPLRPGMALEADILGERRKLYEWVLEPLYSLNGKIGG